LIPIAVYFGLCLFAWLAFDKILFQPPSEDYVDTADLIKLRTSDGGTISAKFYENDAAAHTILFSHGNAEDISSIEPFILKLHDSGFAILTYDYRGYGESDGEPSERNTYLDIDAAYKYLTETRKIPPANIILHGRSLGGGPSVDLAAREQVGGLIMESAFTSASCVLTNYRVIPFEKFDNITKISHVTCPVMIIHGKMDVTIPLHHGEQLFKAANKPKYILLLDNVGHNNMFSVAGEQYLAAVGNFSNSLMAASKSRE